MLTTIIAYSIFITNPTGTLGPHPVSHNAPYFFYEESQMREYKAVEECEAVASKVREDLALKADQLFRAANTAQKEADYVQQKAKYQSLKCLSVERQIDTDYANTADGSKPATNNDHKPMIVEDDKPNKLIVGYRIGRIDSDKNFHGTAYNTKPYKTNDDCDIGYKKTLSAVMEDATHKGANSEQSVDMLNQFQAKYACHQVLLDPNEKGEEPTPPSHIVEEAVKPPVQQAVVLAPLPPIPATTVVPQLPTVPTTVMPPTGYVASMQQYQIPQPSLVRYIVMENVLLTNGQIQKIYYEGSFPTVPQCYGAVEEYMKQLEASTRMQYQAYPSAQAYSNMNATLAGLANKRQHIACVKMTM